MSPEPPILVPAETVRAQITAVLTSWGMEPGLIRTTAEVMVETDLAGVDSHGVSMLMDYDASRQSGKLNLQARPRVVRENPVTALLDADAGLGHPASVMAMQLAMKKAKAAGVGVVAVRNSHHFGAAGYYASLASAEGLVGLVTSATRTISMVPTRARKALLGTNPIAFSAPAARNRAFRLDMATTTTAANKVRVYGLNGRTLPEGWAVDGAGNPVRDPEEARRIIRSSEEGGLTPLGGKPETASHKGYGLAMMVHILGGVLSGASFSPLRVRTQRPEDPDNLGHFFLALDPDAFRDKGEFEADLDEVVDVLHAAPPVDPALPVLVPGDPEAASRERRLREGIPIPRSLAAQLRAVCLGCGAPYLLE
ncbi:Ldh family oxidoreductase [Roseomonas sp. KE2513]|uniref:Ldh family oxidoreductase n=1 Tax=Roseomonas sp. KE2513 TaxID=2479202 RepID=UPI0018DF730E|nr:Ldh family oxidoreductase [Roseomonas sp. KE2513]